MGKWAYTEEHIQLLSRKFASIFVQTVLTPVGPAFEVGGRRGRSRAGPLATGTFGGSGLTSLYGGTLVKCLRGAECSKSSMESWFNGL